MPNVLGPSGAVETRSVSMYSTQWETVEQYAKGEGFNISLSLRKIVDEWVEFKRHQLTDTVIGYEVQRD